MFKLTELYVHLTMRSANVKTGPIPVSTTERASCPDVCIFKKQGCYGENYGLNFLWNRVDNRSTGTDWETFCAQIKTLPENQLWRHNQAGDLPGFDNLIDGYALGALVNANIGKRGFTYTHYDPSLGDNAKYIKGCNDWGFTVNFSANSLEHADQLAALEIAPVTVVLESTQTTNTQTPQGRKVVICPATIREDIDCARCQLCARVDREAIIGFPAHGTSLKKAEAALTFWSKK